MSLNSLRLGKHPYASKRVVLTTKHDKLKLIKPAFDQFIGCDLFEANLDTDQLGTFTGEIERIAPPRETAIAKAKLGMNATGTPIGIASEGSIGPDPLIPFVNSNIEHLVLVDDENQIVISEVFRSFDITAATTTASVGQELSDFLIKADFPAHRLIVRSNSNKKGACTKGISSLDDLIQAIENISKFSADGLVVVESDLRAMYSPSRQKNIQEVANLLAKRVSQLCPQCQMPGWDRVGYEKGVECAECKEENPTASRQEKLGCTKCDYTQLGEVVSLSLDPAQCQFCNP